LFLISKSNRKEKEMADNKLTTQNGGSITTGRKFGAKLSPLQQRIAAAAQETKLQNRDASTMPHRIGLMLDVSGSMNGFKMDMLRLAARTFLEQCSTDDTAVSINTFEPTLRIPLSLDHTVNAALCGGLVDTGGTPMGGAMYQMLHEEPITRGVLVSDGSPTDGELWHNAAEDYKQAGITIDTVHIGEGSGGEEVLKTIAEMTGGKFIKFTDASAFGRSFKYLTPAYRAMLNDSNAAALIGATEVK
jgi:Mg-chelatase subunit ChlD